jgi:hypothetical protein
MTSTVFSRSKPRISATWPSPADWLAPDTAKPKNPARDTVTATWGKPVRPGSAAMIVRNYLSSPPTSRDA